MALISLNEVTLPHFEGNKNLQEVIRFVTSNHLEADKMIVSIRYNHQEINQADTALESTLIKNNDLIQIYSQNRLDIVFSLLEKSSLCLDQLIDKTSKVSNLYAEGEIEKADIYFIDLINTLDLFIELMTNIHRSVRIELSMKMSSGKTFHELEIHLLSVLKAVLKAKEKQDLIMLYDLIEYELLDNLKQWKIIAIPELRNLKQV